MRSQSAWLSRRKRPLEIRVCNMKDSIRDDIFSIWSQSATLAEIERVIVQPNSDQIEIVRGEKSRKLREVVSMPGINSRRALEPIEDLGFPVFPTVESGCAFGIKPRSDGLKMVTTWLGALVAAKGEKVTIATAAVACSPEKLGPQDIVLGTQDAEGVTLSDPNLGSKVRKIAENAIQRFATALAEQLSANY
jgi:hypothetical protein